MYVYMYGCMNDIANMHEMYVCMCINQSGHTLRFYNDICMRVCVCVCLYVQIPGS